MWWFSQMNSAVFTYLPNLVVPQVTGRTFGDKDFRSGLENGVLLCELLNSIKPGLVKKINRLPTPLAGLDNIALFLRGCKKLGLKESQLFDAGDLQDTSSRATVKNLDCSRKLKNVLVTIYWLGKTANSSTYFSGATLNLKEFEGLLTQMKKETEEDVESPKRSIRDSGYVDCWDSERSDSLSPPRHGRDDSFDSLDSFGSRSQQTPSPDVVLRGSSDGRGSDSESDLPHRKLPDVKKDDMSARRTSYGEPKSVVPFNQYLPNKSNQTAYIPAPLRKKKAEREEYRKSWSTATSPLGGERPLSKSHPETIEEEQSEVLVQSEEECLGCGVSAATPPAKPVQTEVNQRDPLHQSPTYSANKPAGTRSNEKDPKELSKLRRLEQAGIKIMPAAQRYGSSQKQMCKMGELTPDIILRKENPFTLCYQQKDSGSEEEREDRIPDLEKDDFAIRKARLNQLKVTLPFNQYLLGSYANKDRGKVEEGKKQKKKQECSSGKKIRMTSTRPMVICEDKLFLQSQEDESEEKDQSKVPDIQRDDLARRKNQASPSQLDLPIFVRASITEADQEIWDRLKVSGKTSDEALTDAQDSFLSSEMAVEAADRNSFASHKVRMCKATSPKQRFVHFGPVTEIEHQKWENLSIARATPKDEMEEAASRERAGALGTSSESSSLLSVSHVNSIGHTDEFHRPHANPSEIIMSHMDAYNSSLLDACADSQKQTPSSLSEWHESSEEEMDGSFPDIERDDMLARRFGTFQKSTSPVCPCCPSISVVNYHPLKQEGKQWKTPQKAESRSSSLTCATRHCPGAPSLMSLSSIVTCEDGCGKSKNQDEHKNNTTGDKAGFRNPGKDDMMVRRTGAFLKQTGPSISQFLPVPFSKQQNGEEATKELVKTEQKVKSITMTDSTVMGKHAKLCAESPQRLVVQPECKLEHEKHNFPGLRREDVSSVVHKDLFDSKPVPLGDSLGMQLIERNCKESPPLKDEPMQIFGSRTPVSDDAESVSMFDMRCADEAAVMQPHSKARHEKLQTIHSQLKEDEDRWQDDLARWKSRRRSASQDLLKKEAERKKMERLLTGADGASERRKSIKTYREIVEEKERRERELHEAYKNAKSREEADSILQQYIERFTISEAVLERLEMPKILERSHSDEPNSSSPPKDPNPLRYLRQQSLPAPKYTAKVEATIAPTSGSEASISAGCTSPSKPFLSKAVPMLTPKPYSQPRNTQQVLKTFKIDGNVSMNGQAVNGVEEEQERECATLIFAPSPSRSPKSDSVEVDGASVDGEQNATSTELVLKRLIEHSKDREQTGTLIEEAKPINQDDKTDPERPSSDHKEFSTTVSCVSPTVAIVEFSSLSNHYKEMGSKDELKKLERGQQKEEEAPVIQKVEILEAPVQDGGIVLPLLKMIPEKSQVVLQHSAPQASTENSGKSNRFGCWSWDPEQERKRQERWQHEQERLLQERYQKEQDKLKEEWEKAQREVEEEERKYYEEERKIIEDTVVPFTVTSSSAEPLSTSSSVTDGNGTMNMVDVSYSEAEDKQKEDRTLKKLFFGQDGAAFSKNKEYEPWKENMSTANKEEYLETSKQKGNEQVTQISRPECLLPTEMTLPLHQDVPWNQQLLTKQSPHISDTTQKNSPLEHNLDLPVSSTRESRRVGCQESSRTGPSSPCSPAIQSHSPNRYKRSVSGKKLCSSCGQPLGKGAAMIIETLGLYFHIQCFRCGICKEQLGDAASGTDVRIRNGLLNCNDCYIRSRSVANGNTLLKVTSVLTAYVLSSHFLAHLQI
ncbi:LIM and calponin homology domains-containing protein 1 isoform X5 [Rhineura floridana]|uniref:LIM and calponin homology domains-containing protein 1 isoform X5 n=1 Tax=Rhineura floridana TaxID=261503 RepID=UPI002AC7F591|nr:LIM and calponin homology domains-containing protein 1 isoform X5 [Rhineura floridana]